MNLCTFSLYKSNKDRNRVINNINFLFDEYKRNIKNLYWVALAWINIDDTQKVPDQSRSATWKSGPTNPSSGTIHGCLTSQLLHSDICPTASWTQPKKKIPLRKYEAYSGNTNLHRKRAVSFFPDKALNTSLTYHQPPSLFKSSTI